MAEYRYGKDQKTIVKDNKICIPYDVNNMDYIEYVKWASNKGNVTLPYVDPREAWTEKQKALMALSATDIGIIRAVEDILIMLKDKKVITDNDIPDALKEKIAKREELRAVLNS